MQNDLLNRITAAKDKHPEYKYYVESYNSKDRKINIECPKHGVFRQRLYYSMLGSICPECADERKGKHRLLTTNEFIRRAKEIHGDKYDYSQVVYINSQIPVCIICPEHGEFWQIPASHINQNSGCPKCSGLARKNNEEFIENAKQIHGDKYDYSRVEYKNNRLKVCIICPEHGEFWQTPKIHLRGFGCKKCSNNYLDKETFSKKAREIHGDKYDYSNVNYVNNHTKVKIICPEHGEFEQIPNSHLNGRGCPLCKTSHLEFEMDAFLKNNLGRLYIYQYHNKDIFEKQSLDFYIPSCKMAVECQGEQHVIPNFFKSKGVEYAEKHLEYIKELDKKKKEICEQNGIELIYYADKKLIKHFDNYLGKVFTDKEELLTYINSKKLTI